MPSNKYRWVYFSTVLDLEIFDIILYSCKYKIFDKKEIILDVTAQKFPPAVTDYMIDEEIRSQLTGIIKDKKNRHIIYMLGKSDPVQVKQQVSKLIKEISPRSKFLFNLVCKDEQYINHKEFYSIYCLNGCRLSFHKEQESCK